MSAATRNPSAPHITLPEGLPGIRGPMAFRPETAKPLNELVDVLLRGPHTLTQAERELIATYVSAQNECRYCQTIHGAIAAHHLRGNEDLVVKVKPIRNRAPDDPDFYRQRAAIVARNGYAASTIQGPS